MPDFLPIFSHIQNFFFCVFSVFPSFASLLHSPPPRRQFAEPRDILEASRSYITLSGPPLSVNHRLFTSFQPTYLDQSPSSYLPPSSPLSNYSTTYPPLLPYLNLFRYLLHFSFIIAYPFIHHLPSYQIPLAPSHPSLLSLGNSWTLISYFTFIFQFFLIIIILPYFLRLYPPPIVISIFVSSSSLYFSFLYLLSIYKSTLCSQFPAHLHQHP